MKKGAMKMMPERVMSAPPFSPAAPPAPPSPNRISIASAFLRKLSFSAEQSWHQNSGANRRDVIRLLNITNPPPPRGPERSRSECSHKLLCIFSMKMMATR
jgi:hypothetical protein